MKEKTNAYIADLVNGILDQLGQEMPQGTEVKAPSLEGVDLKWGRFALQLDYANLPPSGSRQLGRRHGHGSG